MKKIISIFVLLILLGCGDNGRRETSLKNDLPNVIQKPEDTSPGKENDSPHGSPRTDEIPYMENAEFPGGVEKMKEFIARNINYSDAAKLQNQNTVYVSCMVKKNGLISDIKILKGIVECPKCDEEAIRLVKKMPKWKPAKDNNGLITDQIVYFPIRFAKRSE